MCLILRTVFVLTIGSLCAQGQTPVHQWAFNIESTGGTSEAGEGIAVDNSGNVVVIGLFSDTADFDASPNEANIISGGGYDLFLAKYSPMGEYKWAFNIGGLSDEKGYDVTTDDEGDIFIIGDFSSTIDLDPGMGTAIETNNGDSDVLVAKYDSAGNYIWSIAIGGSGEDHGAAVTVDTMGNVYVTGSFSDTVDFDPGPGTSILTSNGNLDTYVAKYNADGEYQWALRFGGDFNSNGEDLVVDEVGSVYVTGSFADTVDFDPGPAEVNLISDIGYDIFLAKYNSSGEYQWAFKVGSIDNVFGTGPDIGYGIAMDQADNIYIAGSVGEPTDFDPGPGTSILSAAGDGFLAKYSVDGHYKWALGIAGAGSNRAHGVAVDSFDNVYVTGVLQETADFDPDTSTANLTSVGNSDVFVAKYDTAGNYSWAFGIGSTGADFGYAICTDNMGALLTTGFISATVDFDPDLDVNSGTPVGGRDAFVGKYYNCQLQANIGSISFSCEGSNDGQAFSTPTGESGPFSYSWNTVPEQTNDTIYGLEVGTYTVTVSLQNGCSVTDSVAITGPDTVPTVAICLITVDTLSSHNIIFWEKPITALIDSFYVYREVTTNVFEHIGSVSYDSLSQYHDYDANPNVTSYKYRLTTLDTCVTESVPTEYHSSIHLQHLGNGNLSWTLYEIEDASNPVTFYRVYRDDIGSGNFQPINSTIPGGNSTFTDVDFASFPNAAYLVDVNWDILCSPTRETVNTTRSNLLLFLSPVSAEDLENTISVYPNPSDRSSILRIQSPFAINHIHIYDSYGRLVLSETTKDTMNLELTTAALSMGVYTIHCVGKQNAAFSKYVIQ